VNSIGQPQINQQIDFTGNWFIDIGMLGFINLMEEVYGWNLDVLREEIESEPEKVYYGYFPLAYIRYNLMKQREKKLNKTNNNELPFFKGSVDKKQIFEESWKFIEDNYLDDDGRIPLSSSNEFYYFHNFLFFQPKWKKEKQKSAFEEILGLKNLEDDVLVHIDKTVCKFLPSKEEFPNISYTGSLITNDTLQNIVPHSTIFVLTFPLGFISFINEKDEKENRRTMFYSSDMKFSYKINKKIKQMVERSTEKKESIFTVTWEAIIDTLIELKSQWALENMYLVSYNLTDNQNLINVEYIGIPKLQAAIIMDDTIRENLNKYIRYSKEIKWKWLIQEFIKGNLLYPTIMNHLNLVLNKDLELSYSSSLYSLLVESKILEFKKKNEKSQIFSPDYFDNYKSLIKNIKDEISFTSFASGLINQISESAETKNRIARELFETLKSNNKNMFLNILLKNLNGNKELSSNRNFYNWILKKIIANNTSFEMYGLILVMNLLRRKKNE